MTTPLRLPAPVAEKWDWQLDAACRGMDVALFFHPAAERRSTKQRRIDRAKAVCGGCPVQQECLQQALTSIEPYGIWGGLSEEERANLLGRASLRYPSRTPRRRRKDPVLVGATGIAAPDAPVDAPPP